MAAGQGTPNITVQWNNDPGSATLSLTVNLCNSSLTTTLPVSVNAALAPTITQTGILCPGVPAMLNAGPGYANYAWSSGPSDPAFQTITITTGGIYTVTVTDGSGCTATDSYRAIALAGPVADISTGDFTTLCINPPNSLTVTINAQTNPNYSFMWYCNGILQVLPATQAFFTHTNTNTNAPGTFSYNVVVTDNNGCKDTSNVIIVTQVVCMGNGMGGCNADPYTLAITSMNQTPNCDSVAFTVSSSPNVTLTGWNFGDPNGNTNTGTLANAAHVYSKAGCFLATLSATVPGVPGGTCTVTETESVCVPLVANFNFSVACLQVNFTNLTTLLPGTGPIANGCTMVPDSVTVVVYPPPPAVISGNLVICDAGCTTLSASGGFNYTYVWLDNSLTPLVPAQILPTLTVCAANLQPGYAVMVTDANGCSAISAVVVVSLAVSPAFSVTVQPDSCAGTPAILTVVPVQPNVVYAWSNGGTGPTITVLQAGVYNVVGTDTITGCKGYGSQTIHPLPDLCIVPVGCYEICNPDTICGPDSLSAYQWNLHGVPIPGATGQCLIVMQSGTYTLTGATAFGCATTSDSLELMVIDCACEQLSVSAEPSLEDSCCWILSYDNQYGDLFGVVIHSDDAGFDFSNLDTSALQVFSIGANTISLVSNQSGQPLPLGALKDFLPPSTTMTINNPFGSGWSTGSYTPTMIELDVVPPLGTTLPLGVVTLPTICIKREQAPPQLLEIKWMQGDSVLCRDTVEFSCEPDCGYLLEEIVVCKENGVWNYSGLIKNTSAFTMGAPATVGDTICFTVALHELNDDAQHLNCCTFHDCIVLTECPVDCFCDAAFQKYAQLGINCTILPTPPNTATFSPGAPLTSCDLVIWSWSDTPMTDTTYGQASITHTFPGPGSYKVCMLVYRNDPVNQMECKYEVCKKIVFLPVSVPDPGVLDLYPNPSKGSFHVRGSLPWPGTVQFRVANLYGQALQEWEVRDAAGQDQIPVALDRLDKGVYLLEISSAGKRWVKKVVIQ